MRFEELAPGALVRWDLRAASGEERLQYTPRWLDFVATSLAPICGPGARLSVLAALDGAEALAAIPMLRTSEDERPHPFPVDLEDYFFGLWIRNLGPADRAMRARALVSQAAGAVVGALNPSLRRALVVHGPLAPASDALVAPRLAPARACEVLSQLLDRARKIAEDEDRCAFVPRVMRKDAGPWSKALAGWTRVAGYSNAEYLPGAPLERRTRQMIRRNARLMERASVTVETRRDAPADIPFGALFARTAERHRDPALLLDDSFFQRLAERFAPQARFLYARRAGRAVGFLAVLEHGSSWEAWKCGTDRALAGDAPVYLDLLYGRLREMALAEGVARVDLGPGDLDVKLHYGARTCPLDSYVALPPRFRGRGAFTAYLREVGDGIARREGGGPDR